MLDIEDVADQLKVSESTIRGLVRSGKLRAYRLGGKRGRLRFKEADLTAYVDSTLVRPEQSNDETDASQDAYQKMREHTDIGQSDSD